MRKQYSFFILIAASSSLLCMERTSIKDIIGYDFFPYHFSHSTICSLALVDKKHNAMIQETAQLRKNYLRGYPYVEDLLKDIALKAAWHKYGSAYIFIDQEYTPRSMHFYFVCLASAGKVKRASGSDSKGGIIYHEGCQPRFHDKRVSFYVREPFIVDGVDVGSKHLVEYSLGIGTKHILKKLCCVIDLEEQLGELPSLTELLDFPTLLYAILQSIQVREDTIYERIVDSVSQLGFMQRYQAKMYSIEGAVIPDNYRLCKPFRISEELPVTKTFDELPDLIRDAVIKRYEEQKIEQKK